MPGGESLAQVEERMVAGLQDALAAHPGEDLVIGTHGTALCVLIHHFVPAFGLEQFAEMVEKLPWAVCMAFEEGRFSGWEVADISF
nr:histidine phosphatase family protein [Bittarella massiliensis (ex Durand et al. 2017)]